MIIICLPKKSDPSIEPAEFRRKSVKREKLEVWCSANCTIQQLANKCNSFDYIPKCQHWVNFRTCFLRPSCILHFIPFISYVYLLAYTLSMHKGSPNSVTSTLWPLLVSLLYTWVLYCIHSLPCFNLVCILLYFTGI